MNEFRRDPLTGQVVIVATARDDRPNHFAAAARADPDFGAADCPFCAHQMDTPPVIARYGEGDEVPWEVCVVPNLYPVLPASPSSAQSGGADLDAPIAEAQGYHEVVVESPHHVTSVDDLSRAQFGFMALAYRDRMRWMRDQGMKYALPMKNSGAAAGASLPHCHSQIFGLPFVPERVQCELEGATRYLREESTCFFCERIGEAVRGDAHRVVSDGEFIAFCPYASRFAYEVWIAPQDHKARFEQESDETVWQFGAFLHDVLRRMLRHPRITAFNVLLHSLPFDTTREDHYHWHIEIIPRIAKVAGFEWGSGLHINTVAPEHAARELRGCD